MGVGGSEGKSAAPEASGSRAAQCCGHGNRGSGDPCHGASPRAFLPRAGQRRREMRPRGETARQGGTKAPGEAVRRKIAGWASASASRRRRHATWRCRAVSRAEEPGGGGTGGATPCLMGRSRSRTGPGRGVAARGRPDGERADGEPQPEARDTGVHARRSGFAVRVFCSSWRGMAGVQTRGLEIAEALAVRRFSILSPVGRAGLTLAVARGCSPSRDISHPT